MPSQFPSYLQCKSGGGKTRTLPGNKPDGWRVLRCGSPQPSPRARPTAAPIRLGGAIALAHAYSYQDLWFPIYLVGCTHQGSERAEGCSCISSAPVALLFPAWPWFSAWRPSQQILNFRGKGRGKGNGMKTKQMGKRLK